MTAPAATGNPTSTGEAMTKKEQAMTKSEIIIGGLYRAKVSRRIVTVRVNRIYDGAGYGKRKIITYYDVINLSTRRKTRFRSAAKFLSADEPEPVGASNEKAPTDSRKPVIWFIGRE